jgi:hypothetical protein
MEFAPGNCLWRPIVDPGQSDSRIAALFFIVRRQKEIPVSDDPNCAVHIETAARGTGRRNHL